MATMTIRCDDADKKAAAAVAEFYGFDLSSVTRAFWKQMARTQRIPLDLGNGPSSSDQETKALAGKTETLKAIERVSANFPAIKRAILFGSLARGTFNENSDVDVRLELNRNKRFNLRDLSHYAKQIEQLTGREVDVVSADEIQDEQLKAAIIRDGVIAYERQEQ